MVNLPTEFASRMKALLGDEYALYEKAMDEPPVRALRVNTDKISVDEFKAICPFKIEPIPYVPNGFYFEQDKIGNHPFHHAGMFYVQEPGAMAPAECVEIEPDWWVLDMCAAPGGKSTQLKNKLGEKGVLLSNEIIPSRCKILTGNMERLGLKNTITTCMDTARLATLYPNTFDMIMVDAPCSGEGMFRKEEAATAEWSTDNVKMCAARQAEILDNAAKMVKGGGYIVYATCTFSLEENEENVNRFLEAHPDFRLITPSEKSRLASVEGKIPDTRRLYPHTSVGEGQFFALFERIDGENLSFTGKSALSYLPEGDGRIIREFLEKNLASIPRGTICQFKENAVLVPDNLPVPERISYSCGVTLGRVEKKVFRPHHQLFSALGQLFKNKIDLSPDSPELEKYLRGETFTTCAPDGWACVTVDSAPLGGVKITGGVAKNHYPKGLRNLT